MSKKMSRRAFLKSAALGAVSVGVLGRGVAALAEEGSAIYNAGTYTSEQATGFATVKVTTTFSDTKIEEISYEVVETSASDFFPNFKDQLDAMLASIKEGQSVNVDAVSGATLCSDALKNGVSDCISQASVNAEPAEEKKGGPGGPGGPGGFGANLSIEDAKAQAKADGRVWGYAGPGDWLGEAPTVSAVTKELDCDVLVVGCGHAGVQAAYAAAEAGAKVICVEKQPQTSFAWYGEDFGAWNSKLMIEQGFGPYNLGEVIDEFVSRGGGRSNQEIVRQYVARSGECMDNMLAVAKEMGVDSRAYTYDNTPDGWLIIQANVDYDKYQETGDMYASLRKNYPIKPGTRTWAASHQFMGVYNDEPIQGVAANSVLPLINQALITKAQKDFGADYYFGVAGVKLIQNENGDVIGAYVQDTATGEFWKVNAAKGVVVCGGDYAGNADMCWSTLNEKMEKAERAGLLKKDFWSFMGGRDGSAIKMCCWAGGFIETSPRGDMSLGGGPSGPWGCNAMLWLNGEGRRFCNEGNITGAQSAAYRQKKGTGLLITDKKWFKSVCASGIEHGGPNAGRPQYYIDMVNDMNAIQPGTIGKVKNCTIAERGYSNVACANTIEELFDLLEIYPDADVRAKAIEQIKRYNELCAAGSDEDYGKDASAMIAVDEGPFYGITASFGPGSTTPMMVTMSGMLTDDDLRVLDASGNPIKGLYVAGNCLGGRYGTGYSTPCAGNSIGFAGTHGRIAGQNAAKAE